MQQLPASEKSPVAAPFAAVFVVAPLATVVGVGEDNGRPMVTSLAAVAGAGEEPDSVCSIDDDHSQLLLKHHCPHAA